MLHEFNSVVLQEMSIFRLADIYREYVNGGITWMDIVSRYLPEDLSKEDGFLLLQAAENLHKLGL